MGPAIWEPAQPGPAGLCSLRICDWSTHPRNRRMSAWSLRRNVNGRCNAS